MTAASMEVAVNTPQINETISREHIGQERTQGNRNITGVDRGVGGETGAVLQEKEQQEAREGAKKPGNKAFQRVPMANSAPATKMFSSERAEKVSVPCITAKITSEPSKGKKRQREHFCGVEGAITKLLWWRSKQKVKKYSLA